MEDRYNVASWEQTSGPTIGGSVTQLYIWPPARHRYAFAMLFTSAIVDEFILDVIKYYKNGTVDNN